MDPRIIHRITLHVAAVGAILAGIAFMVVGGEPAVGTLVGAVLAVVNWLSFRWLFGRIAGGMKKKAGVMMLLVLKMGLLMAICYFLIVRLGIHPLGMVVGLGALPIGVILGASRSASREEMATADGEPTEEA